MAVFFTDLDNTLIYSYRHEIGREKMCVELYQGREVSFITKRTWELLQQVKKQVLIIPVTTRTQEQYHRIDLKIGTPEYALTCNGGVLLVQGIEDKDWYEESLTLIAECSQELKEAQALMESDPNRSFEVRNIRDLFLFTKSSEPGQSVEYLAQHTNQDLVEVFQNGVKVYVVPRKLNKGTAVRRFLKRLCVEGREEELVIAAGDSNFDIAMLKQAKVAFAPTALEYTYQLPGNTIVLDEKRVFSEVLLEQVLQYSIKK